MGPKSIKKSESTKLQLNGIKQFNSTSAMEAMTKNYYPNEEDDIDDILLAFSCSRSGLTPLKKDQTSSLSSSMGRVTPGGSLPSLTSPNSTNSSKRMRILDEEMDLEEKKVESSESSITVSEGEEEEQPIKRKRAKSGKPRKMNEENIAYFARKYMEEVEKPRNSHMMYEKYGTTKIGGGHQIYMRFIRWLDKDQFEIVCKRGGDDGGFRSVTKAVHQYMQEKFHPEQTTNNVTI